MRRDRALKIVLVVVGLIFSSFAALVHAKNSKVVKEKPAPRQNPAQSRTCIISFQQDQC
jgi:hypothetical protein